MGQFDSNHHGDGAGATINRFGRSRLGWRRGGLDSPLYLRSADGTGLTLEGGERAQFDSLMGTAPD